jgi:hypothetical protein
MDTLSFSALIFVAVVLLIVLLRRAARPAAKHASRKPLPVARPRPATENTGLEEPKTRFLETPQRSQPYQLLNSAEQTLYRHLCEAMPNMLIFSQVSMAHLARLRGKKALEENRAMLGRSVDFLVCRADFAILAAIELVWPSSSSAADGQKVPPRATEKRAALESLGIPLIVFPPNHLPDPESLGRAVAEAIVRRKILENERRRASGGSQISQFSQF